MLLPPVNVVNTPLHPMHNLYVNPLPNHNQAKPCRPALSLRSPPRSTNPPQTLYKLLYFYKWFYKVYKRSYKRSYTWPYTWSYNGPTNWRGLWRLLASSGFARPLMGFVRYPDLAGWFSAEIWHCCSMFGSLLGYVWLLFFVPVDW